MAIDAPIVPERRSGLSTALNVIISPGEAFETLRVVPMWGWALIIVVILTLIGTFLAYPAQMHVMQTTMQHAMATDPNAASLTDAQKAQRMAIAEKFGAIGFLFVPIVFLLVALLQTLVFLVFNAIGRGKASFKTLWASAINIDVVGFGLFQLVSGILVMVKGPNAFNTPIDSLLTVPSLAWLAPNAAPKTLAMLSTINPFTIWTFVLVVMMMTIVARVAKVHAYLTAATLVVIGALFSTLAIR